MTISRYIAVGKHEKSLEWLTEHLPRLFVSVTTPAALLAQMEPVAETLFLVDGAAPAALTGLVANAPHAVWIGAKPVQLSELIRQIAGYSAPMAQNIALSAECVFLPTNRVLRGKKAEVALTEREADLLEYLAKVRGKLVAREELFRNIWGFHTDLDTHTLETHIYRLRGKLAESGENPGVIETIEGGYRLV